MRIRQIHFVTNRFHHQNKNILVQRLVFSWWLRRGKYYKELYLNNAQLLCSLIHYSVTLFKRCDNTIDGDSCCYNSSIYRRYKLIRRCIFLIFGLDSLAKITLTKCRWDSVVKCTPNAAEKIFHCALISDNTYVA